MHSTFSRREELVPLGPKFGWKYKKPLIGTIKFIAWKAKICLHVLRRDEPTKGSSTQILRDNSGCFLCTHWVEGGRAENRLYSPSAVNMTYTWPEHFFPLVVSKSPPHSTYIFIFGLACFVSIERHQRLPCPSHLTTSDSMWCVIRASC